MDPRAADGLPTHGRRRHRTGHSSRRLHSRERLPWSHALFKTDPLPQRANARFPWITTWDDHEVSNNYSNDIQENGQPKEDFLKRRAWAYQAFYEHLPLRISLLPQAPNVLLHRPAKFGQLLRLRMLDTLQIRSDQPCGDGIKKACEDLRNPAQTLLGEHQEKWQDEWPCKSSTRCRTSTRVPMRCSTWTRGLAIRWHASVWSILCRHAPSATR